MCDIAVAQALVTKQATRQSRALQPWDRRHLLCTSPGCRLTSCLQTRGISTEKLSLHSSGVQCFRALPIPQPGTCRRNCSRCTHGQSEQHKAPDLICTCTCTYLERLPAGVSRCISPPLPAKVGVNITMVSDCLRSTNYHSPTNESSLGRCFRSSQTPFGREYTSVLKSDNAPDVHRQSSGYRIPQGHGRDTIQRLLINAID